MQCDGKLSNVANVNFFYNFTDFIRHLKILHVSLVHPESLEMVKTLTRTGAKTIVISRVVIRSTSYNASVRASYPDLREMILNFWFNCSINNTSLVYSNKEHMIANGILTKIETLNMPTPTQRSITVAEIFLWS